jgi:hypothetical protein
MDIRTPIGLMFLVKGLILAAYGAATGGSDLYQRSLNFNLNFYWGGILIVFGVVMLGLARASARPESC